MGYGLNYGYGFMGGWGGGAIMWLACIVWTVVGVLAAIWLWQQINRK